MVTCSTVSHHLVATETEGPVETANVSICWSLKMSPTFWNTDIWASMDTIFPWDEVRIITILRLQLAKLLSSGSNIPISLMQLKFKRLFWNMTIHTSHMIMILFWHLEEGTLQLQLGSKPNQTTCMCKIYPISLATNQQNASETYRFGDPSVIFTLCSKYESFLNIGPIQLQAKTPRVNVCDKHPHRWTLPALFTGGETNYAYFWVRYNDLTTTSQWMMVSKENHPQWPKHSG